MEAHVIPIEIEGPPVAAARPRITRFGSYNPQKDLMKQVAWEIKKQWRDKPLTGPLFVRMEFHVALPASWSKKKKQALLGQPKPTKPDLSNYIKFIEDAANGILWEDDNQIVQLEAKKLYASTPKTIMLVDFAS